MQSARWEAPCLQVPRWVTQSLMTDTDDTKECPRCSGRGKYADPQHDPLVQITCPRCEGSGRVPFDSPDEPPVKEPTQIPFGSDPKSR